MYTPSPTILKKYAEVLVTFALNSGTGIKKNDTVYLVTQTPAIPLAKEVYSAVLKAGGHVITNILDDSLKSTFLENASEAQLAFFPKKYYDGIASSIDHWVRLLADDDPMYLKSIEASKIVASNKANKPFREWLDTKEDNGKFTWTLCLYGTSGMAHEAGLSEKEYWDEIIKACYLDKKDPVATWKKVFAQVHEIEQTLSAMPINLLHVKSKNTDLNITLGEKRQWLGGSGRNIPSFEIFTSPDWRGTNGTIFFDLPLYQYGNIIKDISLEFKNGCIIKAHAKKNEALLHAMIKQKNADKVGEFSLTDKRFSRISKFMANTLFDENFGGEFGNTHIAIGKSYHDTCTLNPKTTTSAEYKKLGFNESVEHTDIISTSDRVITATLKDGSKKVIYAGGEFQLHGV